MATTTATIVRLSNVTATTIRWIDPGRIPLGTLTVLDGDPGVGKSTVSLDYATRVTLGARMPGKHKGDLFGKPAGVVLLSAEDDPAATLRPKLEAMGADLSKVALLHSVKDEDDETARGVDLTDLDALGQAVRHVRAKLVIVDPLMAYLPTRANAHRDQDVRAILTPLIALAAELDVAIVIVRHLNKLSGDSHAVSALYRGGGSIGIAGAARSVLLVAYDPADEMRERRVMVRVKGNLTKPPKGLLFSLQGDPAIVKWEGEAAEDADDLLAVVTPDMEPSKIKEAVAWLRGRLTDTPALARDLFREAKRDGITERSLSRARKKLGARARKGEGGPKAGWEWYLPHAVPVDAMARSARCFWD